MFHFLLADGKPSKYFAGSAEKDIGDDEGVRGKGDVKDRVGSTRELWLGGGLFTEALSGFVLGWAGVGGVIR